LDRQSAILLLAGMIFLGALMFYVVDAVQVAGRPASPSATIDLALAPSTHPNVATAARQIYSIVAGQPPNPHAGRAVYGIADSFRDYSPEAETLRYAASQLYEAGMSYDTAKWQDAIAMLCHLAENCN
jgi:hypothetical protein